MKEIFMILVSAILVDNFVLSKFMGICRSSVFPRSWILL